MVCLFLFPTRRTATLSWKTRTQLPKLCQSLLIRSYAQLQGNAMEHNGLFAGQNRKLETHGSISRERSSSRLAEAPNHPKTGTIVLFALVRLPRAALSAPAAPRSAAAHRSQPSPAEPRPQGWCAPSSAHSAPGRGPRKLARLPRERRGGEGRGAEPTRAEPS